MRLAKISDIRKKELRRAAFEVLQREGMAGATLEKVAAHAGASKGIVLHYFANKQELFEHAMREANAELRDAVVARLNQHWFLTLADAREKMEDWRRDYNEVRPHGAIGNKVPISLINPGSETSPPP